MAAVDRVAQILTRIPEQYKGLPGWEGFLTAIAQEIQELEDAHLQLLTLRGVNTATGATLEAIGRFVGEPPSGLSDDLYRRRIRARIRANRSMGTIEDLIAITRLVLNDSTAGVVVRQTGIAALTMRVSEVITSTAIADVIIGMLRDAVSAGVRLILHTALGLPGAMFTLAVGGGLGFGTSAKLNLAPLTVNCDTVIAAREVGTSGNAIKFSISDDGAPGGTLDESGYPGFREIFFYFQEGVTTVAQFEALITSSSQYLWVKTIDGTGTFAIADDYVPLTNLAGGVNGGIFAGARE
jgi:hypothetical protein